MIRDYSNNDISKIISLGKELHDNYKFSLNPFTNYLVYVSDNEIMGFISYDIIYDRAEIIDIIVDDNKRSSGIGSILIKEVFKRCYNNCDNITLEVNEKNTIAISFYLKHGFKKISSRPSYYNKGMEDAYIMEKKLR